MLMMKLSSIVALLAVFAVVSALDGDFAFDVVDDFEVDFDQETGKKSFGQYDRVVATVGKVFHLTVPVPKLDLPNSDKSITYEAKSHGTKSLPSWLLFDKTAGSFWGLPLSEDVAEIHIVIRIYGRPEYTVKEFTLVVEAEESYTEGSNSCADREEGTILALVIDKDVIALKPKQRVVAVNSVAKFFGLPYSAFRLHPLEEPDDLLDSTVVSAGPGDVSTKTSKISSSLEVNVGCGGRLWTKTATIVHQLKQQARDGTISEVMGLPLIGWRVKTQSKSSRRLRRQVDQGSGDYEAYDDDYDNYDDDEYEDEEEVMPPPKATTPKSTTTSTTTTAATTTTTTTTTTAAPITTSKFITTTPEPTSTHHHRHHHGQVDATTKATTTTSTTTTAAPITTEMMIPPKSPETTTHSITSKANSENVDDFYDDYDDDDEEDDDDDAESETIVPDTKTEGKFEIVVDTEPPTVEVTSQKAQTVEVVPETAPTTTTTTSTSTTTTTTPLPITTTVMTIPITASTTTSTTSTTTTTPAPTTTVPTTTAYTTTIKELPTTEEEFASTIPPTTIPPETTFVASTTTTEKTTTTTMTEEQQETTTAVRQTTARHVTTTTRPTTTTPTYRATETIEYEMKNFPPIIQNRLKRIATTAGKMFSYIVPENTFSDIEDGYNLILELLDNEAKPLNKSSWCQFNPMTREIYGLPLEEDISRWEYILKATDKEGASVVDPVEILVQHHKSRRVVNHEFSLYMHIEKKWNFPHDVDWPLKTLRGIGQLYNSNLTDIIVRRVNYTVEPVVFVWTNESLPKSYCPTDEIKELFEVLTANNEGDPSHALTRVLVPELRVKKVMYHGLGMCETKPRPPPLVPITPPTNFSPILRNPVDHINATVGELLVFKVPDDTFYDPEDVDSRNLKMSLLTVDRQQIPSDHWLQFDSKNKEFYGIPLPEDVGRSEYQLVCEDSGGLPASDSLVVVVHVPPKLQYNVEFSMTLETPYETFINSASLQRKFIEKLQELFGDQNTSYIHLSTISRGSTIVSWYNRSLSLSECPRAEIKLLESILVNNDRTIAGRVQDVMDPEFTVSTIKLQLIGSCKGRPNIQSPTSKGVPIEEPPLSDHEDYMITFIVPAVIISVMLLLAGIAACVLYRRRRTGKMNVEEDGRSSYGNKGIPVIFQEELEEKPEPGTKAPIILKDEKPPLAPPEYSKSGSLKLTDDSEPYQPPPPPFTRPQDNGRQSRPKATPTYRKPPPYVPP